MLKVLRYVVIVRPHRLVVGPAGCCCVSTRNITFGSSDVHHLVRCSSSLLLRAAAHVQLSVRWKSDGSSSDNFGEISSRHSNRDDTTDTVVYPCFSDLDDLHIISKEMLSRAGLERMTEIQFKTWGPVLEGRGTWFM
jgi:hypothetical protein